jgi:hypothetical protein
MKMVRSAHPTREKENGSGREVLAYSVRINGRIMGRRSRDLKKSFLKALLTWVWTSSQSWVGSVI